MAGPTLTAPEDIINNALGRIGYKLRIGSIYEGSAAANKALDLYGQARDQLLRDDSYNWQFAERNVTLTLLKSAPALAGGGYGYIPPTVWNPAVNPPLPYLFEYAYPSDCIKIRSLKPTPFLLPEMDPRPVIYKDFNDNSFNPPQKAIACNVPGALLTYTGQVTDPSTWDSGFTEALCEELAKVLAPSFNPEMLKLIVPDAANAQMVAETEQG